MKLYGETQTERDAKKLEQCREIVKEICDFGVNQQQIIRICHLLALELESRPAMLDITDATKKHLSTLDTGVVEQPELIT